MSNHNPHQDDDHATVDTVLHVLVVGGVAAFLGLAVVAHGALSLVA